MVSWLGFDAVYRLVLGLVFDVFFLLSFEMFSCLFWRSLVLDFGGFLLGFDLVSESVLACFCTWFWRGFLFGFGVVSWLVLTWFLA